MTLAETILSIVGLLVALIVGCGQIYIAKQVKDFELRQDGRDEKRRQSQLRADAVSFIQKYNKQGHESELYLLPLCVVAYKYDVSYPWHREMYRTFCSLPEDVQNEILKLCKFDIQCQNVPDYYEHLLQKIDTTINEFYPNDADVASGHYFKEHGRYLRRALTDHGNKLRPDDLLCDVDDYERPFRNSRRGKLARHQDGQMDFREHVTNLLAYEKDKRPFSDLLGIFMQEKDEIIACYMCCLIAKYTACYNYEVDSERCYADDYNGDVYMEDMFLDTLNTVEHYCLHKTILDASFEND